MPPKYRTSQMTGCQKIGNFFHYVPDNEIEGDILGWTTSYLRAVCICTSSVLLRLLFPLLIPEFFLYFFTLTSCIWGIVVSCCSFLIVFTCVYSLSESTHFCFSSIFTLFLVVVLVKIKILLESTCYNCLLRHNLKK